MFKLGSIITNPMNLFLLYLWHFCVPNSVVYGCSYLPLELRGVTVQNCGTLISSCITSFNKTCVPRIVEVSWRRIWGKETYGETGWRLGPEGVRGRGETVRDKHTVSERHIVATLSERHYKVKIHRQNGLTHYGHCMCVYVSLYVYPHINSLPYGPLYPYHQNWGDREEEC